MFRVPQKMQFLFSIRFFMNLKGNWNCTCHVGEAAIQSLVCFEPLELL